MLSLIVARGRDGAIGKDGTIPWRAPEDLAFFQRETMGAAVIMGRHTWESLPFRPLKNRLNIVVSTRHPEDAPVVCGDVESALKAARDNGHSRVYGIGGARIYAALLPMADRLLITEVDVTVPDADTHFPAFDSGAWKRAETMTLRAGDPRCVLHEYLRIPQASRGA